MRRGLGIAAMIAVAISLVAVVSKTRKPSAEQHLKAYYAAQQRYYAARDIGPPTLRRKLVKRWYKLIGKGEIASLNQMGKHRTTLEDLGYLETKAFVVSNRYAFDVQKTVGVNAYLGVGHANSGVNGLVNLWCSGTNRIYVLAPKADMSKWEKWIRQADVAE